MAKIRVEKMSDEQLKKLGVFEWPVWSKEPSAFDWSYSEPERCYILEGRARVKAGDEEAAFGKGDFVTFPAGLKCRWTVEKAVRKHYDMG